MLGNLHEKRFYQDLLNGVDGVDLVTIDYVCDSFIQIHLVYGATMRCGWVKAVVWVRGVPRSCKAEGPLEWEAGKGNQPDGQTTGTLSGKSLVVKGIHRACPFGL